MSLESAAHTRSGFAVVWDTIVAPRAAFETLRDRTHWRSALLVICVLGLIGGFLQIPAGVHVAGQMIGHDPRMATMTAAQQQSALKFAVMSQQYAWLFFPVIAALAILVVSAWFLLGNAVANGRGTFARLFGLSANIAVINYGIGYLLIGLLCRLRGPESFSSTQDLIRLLPSLAWLFPNAPVKLVPLLAAVNPLQIWSFYLITQGLAIVAGLPAVPRYVLATIVTLGSAAIPAALAQ